MLVPEYEGKIMPGYKGISMVLVLGDEDISIGVRGY